MFDGLTGFGVLTGCWVLGIWYCFLGELTDFVLCLVLGLAFLIARFLVIGII